MLKKIQNVWNFIIKIKKITNVTNLYSIKNNLLFTNAVSNSVVFYISSLKNIKIKQLKIINKITTILTLNNLFLILLLTIWFSFMLFLLFFN